MGAYIKLHIGCGKRNWPGWVNIDGEKFNHIVSNDIYCGSFDLDSVSLIYSSHLIAYFDRVEIIGLLKAWYKKLKPGGTLRIATPDHEAMNYLYSNGVHLNYFLGPMYGKMPMAGSTIYHKTVWDFKSLKEFLELNGFVDVERYDHTKTEHAQFDDHSAAYIQGTLISLNVQCHKP